MVLMKDDYQRLHSQKDDLLEKVQKALEDAGVRNFDVESIRLNVKHVKR